MKRIVFCIFIILNFLPLSGQNTTGSTSLFFDEDTFVKARERICKYDWAKESLRRLKKRLDGETDSIAYFGSRWSEEYWTKDAAIYYRITGDEQYNGRIIDNIKAFYKLDSPEETLFPSDTNRNTTNFWQRMMEKDTHILCAYDLMKDHPGLSGYKELMEQRMDEVISEAYLYEGRITRLGNTQFYAITGLGLYGYMRNDKKAVDEAINGKWGFKALLAGFRDNGSFWPEPKSYSTGYVGACTLMLAEASRHNGWPENLYEYEDPETGASIHKMILALIGSCTPDGYSLSNGESSESIKCVGDTIAVIRPNIFSVSDVDPCNRLVMYYNIYRDPVIGWALERVPEKARCCMIYWNESSLLYGTEVDSISAPDAESRVFQEIGDAIIRSDESSDYWNGNATTVHFRNGASIQYHSANDHFSIAVNAFGKNLFNHWTLYWDYLSPRKGRANNTPLTHRIINHNTVTVDFKEPDRSVIHMKRETPEIPGVCFSDISRSGNMKIISAEGEIYDGVRQKRTIGVVDEYVIDIFSVNSDSMHNYDYTLHSWGECNISGTGPAETYDMVNSEYGFGKIDGSSHIRPDNVWLADAKIRKATGDAVIDFRDRDGKGIRTYLQYCPDTKVISAGTPAYVSVKGWDDIPQSGVPERKPMAIVRRNCKSTTFVAVHQPYSGVPEHMEVTKKGSRLTVETDTFRDIYDIRTGEYHRTIK